MSASKHPCMLQFITMHKSIVHPAIHAMHPCIHSPMHLTCGTLQELIERLNFMSASSLNSLGSHLGGGDGGSSGGGGGISSGGGGGSYIGGGCDVYGGEGCGGEW